MCKVLFQALEVTIKQVPDLLELISMGEWADDKL